MITLYYRNSGIGDFQQTENTPIFLATVQHTVTLRIKVNT